jgi:inorganic pyrophosphatase
MCNEKFWALLDTLVKESEIEIDRPKGSRHPRREELVYPVDYGYLKGTLSSDNEGIDVFCGSAEGSLVDAIICIVDMYKRDSEMKVLVGCTEEEKEEIFKIYSVYYNGLQGVLIPRSGKSI